MADARSLYAARVRSGLGPETPDPSGIASPERLEAAEVGHIAFAAPWKVARVMDRFADRRGFAVPGPEASGAGEAGRVPLRPGPAAWRAPRPSACWMSPSPSEAPT